MRNKIFSLVLFFFSFSQLLPTAQSYALVIGSPIRPIPLPIKNTNQTLFGEDQYYTVTFRGNGEAVVDMKAILTNTTNTPLSTITIRLPSHISIANVIAYQVIAQPQCVQYSNAPVDNPKCLQYQQPNYQYVDENTSYQKIIVQQINNAVTLTLPTALNTNDTGSYLLSYRSNDYTQHNIFGAYTVAFQTLKVDDPINSLQVGITTDSDLYLKDAKGTVNYNAQATMMALPTADGAVRNSRFNDFYNQVGEGVITKTASNLEPLESYTVKTMYADAGIKLYGKEIALTIGSIVLLILIIFSIATFLLKRRKNRGKDENNNVDTRIKLLFIAAGISFASVLLTSVYTIGILLLSLFINTNNYYYQLNNMFLFLLIAALSGAVYLFFLFVPTIIMTIKKGFIWGGVTFGLTIMWSLIALVLLLGIAFLFLGNITSPPVVRPLMMGGIKSAAPMLQNTTQ